MNDKEKRFRRNAKDIQRKYQCTRSGCKKAYGSEASLLQHIRLKHANTEQVEPPLITDPC
jgi:hypothetical protein